MFVPVTGFLYLYHLVLNNRLTPLIIDNDATNVILVVFPVMALIDLTIVHWLSSRHLGRHASEPSLGIRLDQYVRVVMMRVVAAVLTSLLMAIGLFLTQHQYFTVYFAVLVLWIVLQWPTPGKVARDYRLKGDEKQMVLTKGEAFK
jgi:small-conductance mechanosensitive channel